MKTPIRLLQNESKTTWYRKSKQMLSQVWKTKYTKYSSELKTLQASRSFFQEIKASSSSCFPVPVAATLLLSHTLVLSNRLDQRDSLTFTHYLSLSDLQEIMKIEEISAVNHWVLAWWEIGDGERTQATRADERACKVGRVQTVRVSERVCKVERARDWKWSDVNRWLE